MRVRVRHPGRMLVSSQETGCGLGWDWAWSLSFQEAHQRLCGIFKASLGGSGSRKADFPCCPASQ